MQYQLVKYTFLHTLKEIKRGHYNLVVTYSQTCKRNTIDLPKHLKLFQLFIWYCRWNCIKVTRIALRSVGKRGDFSWLPLTKRRLFLVFWFSWGAGSGVWGYPLLPRKNVEYHVLKPPFYAFQHTKSVIKSNYLLILYSSQIQWKL